MASLNDAPFRQAWQQPWVQQQNAMPHYQPNSFFQAQPFPPGRRGSNSSAQPSLPLAQNNLGFSVPQVAMEGVRKAMNNVCKQYCQNQAQEENLTRILEEAGVLQAAQRAAHDAACKIVQALHQPGGQAQGHRRVGPCHPRPQQQGIPELSQLQFTLPPPPGTQDAQGVGVPPEAFHAQTLPTNGMMNFFAPQMRPHGMGHGPLGTVATEHWGRFAHRLLLMNVRMIASEGKCLLGQCRANSTINVADFGMMRHIVQKRPDWLGIFPELSGKLTSQSSGDFRSGSLRQNPQAWASSNIIDSHGHLSLVSEQGIPSGMQDESPDVGNPREAWMALQTYDSLPDVALLQPHSGAPGTDNTFPDQSPCLVGVRTFDSLPETDEQGITPDMRDAISNLLQGRGLR